MITSAQNPHIKHLKKCLSSRKHRHEHQQFVCENNTIITHLLTHHPQAIKTLYTSDPTPELIQETTQYNIPIIDISQALIQQISTLKTPGTTLALINIPTHPLPQKSPKKALALYTIKSPSNLGAILRNAQAFACPIIYLLGNCCDPFHPESIRASAGHCLSTPIIHVPIKNIETTLSPYTCWKLDPAGKTPLHALPKTGNHCFIFGSEPGFKDFPNIQTKTCHIPITPQADSLNVAVSSGILLYTTFNS